MTRNRLHLISKKVIKRENETIVKLKILLFVIIYTSRSEPEYGGGGGGGGEHESMRHAIEVDRKVCVCMWRRGTSGNDRKVGDFKTDKQEKKVF